MERLLAQLSKDCEKLMDEYTSYNEKVISGLVVQLYYSAYSLDTVCETDAELCAIAAHDSGLPTGEQGLHRCRRDIDFEFPEVAQASRFAAKINSSVRFSLHQGLNVAGQVIPRPTIEALHQRKNQLKKIHCGSDVCDANNR